MMPISRLKDLIARQAIKLGFDASNPTVNVDFVYLINDVHEDGKFTPLKRHCFYGNSTPKEIDHETVWMRHDNKKIFRYDYSKVLVEEEHTSDLHDTNY